MKYIIVALTLMATPVTATANNIYFRMVSDNTTYTFMNFSPQVAPMMQDIALMALDRPFSLELIHTEYYQVTITRGIVWNDEKVVQYDYIPLVNDRFRNVIWLTEDGKSMVKTTIYDNDSKILYNAICMEVPLPMREVPPALVVTLNESDFVYKGFAAARAEIGEDGTFKMLFSDGLNRFSVFRGPASRGKDGVEEKLVLYGNYVYNRTLDGSIYTAVGTIPYSIMEEVILKLDEMAANGEIRPATGGVDKEKLKEDLTGVNQ